MENRKRLDIKLGFSCNNNCRHCVMGLEKRNSTTDRTTSECFREIKEARENGANELVLTGGEPTIRKDLVDIVAYAKGLGYRLIQMQTNARLLCYRDYVDKLVRAGITEFVPAVHGHEAGLHDFITQAPGSFKQTFQAIKNIRNYDLYLLTNTVLSKLNYKFLPEIARMLVDLNVDQFQFACVHPLGNAGKFYDEVVPNFEEVMPYLHKALDVAEECGTTARVEAVPFCYMQGYEKHVSELYFPEYVELRDIERTIADFGRVRKVSGKKKIPGCRNCMYDLICEGPWREYLERRDFEQLKPVKGKKIRDVSRFMETGYDSKEKKR